MEKKTMIDKLFYFGTDLRDHGHYFFELEKEYFINKNFTNIKNLSFNPEEIFLSSTEKGTVKYLKVGEFNICAICGSCVDKRPGSVSIFWTKKNLDISNFKEVIESITIAKKIIKSMPFKVRW